jgi:hypothetical protein
LVLQKGAIVQELAASRLSDADVVHEIVGMGAAPASGR